MHIQGTKRALNLRKPATHNQLFFHLFKEQMKKFVALLTKEKGKTALNEWENDDSDILQALYSGYKKIRTPLFPYLLVNLFKQK